MSFFKTQSQLTAAKISIYEEYVKGYLPKILQTFQQCFIADLFCGAGKNGDEDGSPLVLIKQAEYILSSPVLEKKHCRIDILFNDKDERNSSNLMLHLSNISTINSAINIRQVGNDDFQKVLSKIMLKLRGSKIPKFFFLDPFTYSDVTLDNLKSLMMLQNSEVFLFIPVFHSYRFSNEVDFPEGHKTRKFVEEFTTEGLSNYSGIDDFMESIKEKIKSELGLKYVRSILLDDGSRKNAIFLLTQHSAGMLLMNKIAFNQSDDGKGINIKEYQSAQMSMFGTQETSKFHMFSVNMEQELRCKESMSNAEIVEFSIVSEFLPRHAKDVLYMLCDKGKLMVSNASGDITMKRAKWNVAEKITKEVFFTYVD